MRSSGPSARPSAPPTVLAALGPKMLQLAAEQADGAHPYFVPVEHTAQAREILGPDPILAPEQMVVLDTDRDESARDRPQGHGRVPPGAELRQQPEAARASPTTTWPTAAASAWSTPSW